jgi:hypothetical protein
LIVKVLLKLKNIIGFQPLTLIFAMPGAPLATRKG